MTGKTELNYNEFMIEYNQLRTEQDRILKPTKEEKLQFQHRHWDLHQKYLTSQLLILTRNTDHSKCSGEKS